MNLPKLYERIRPWLKPGLTILLGLILLFRPDSVTSAIGVAIGFVVSVIGAGLLISFLFDKPKDALRLAAGIILLVIGFSVIKNPLSLASQLGRFIGILLVLQSVRELTGEISLKSKTLSIVTGIVGIVLMLVPMTTSRMVVSGCGIVVLLMGAGMLAQMLRVQKGHGPKDDIIDAE